MILESDISKVIPSSSQRAVLLSLWMTKNRPSRHHRNTRRPRHFLMAIALEQLAHSSCSFERGPYQARSPPHPSTFHFYPSRIQLGTFNCSIPFFSSNLLGLMQG